MTSSCRCLDRASSRRCRVQCRLSTRWILVDSRLSPLSPKCFACWYLAVRCQLPHHIRWRHCHRRTLGFQTWRVRATVAGDYQPSTRTMIHLRIQGPVVKCNRLHRARMTRRHTRYVGLAQRHQPTATSSCVTSATETQPDAAADRWRLSVAMTTAEQCRHCPATDTSC